MTYVPKTFKRPVRAPYAVKTPASPDNATPDIGRACQVFNEIAQEVAIPHHHTKNYCHERAILSCNMLLNSGYHPQKAWVIHNAGMGFSERNSFQYTSPDNNTQNWGYHVAPVLRVSLPEGGLENMVFDPSIFDGPVRLGDWLAKMEFENPRDRQTYTTAPADLPEDYISAFPSFKTRWESQVNLAFSRIKQLITPNARHDVYESPLRKSFSVAASPDPSSRTSYRAVISKPFIFA